MRFVCSLLVMIGLVSAAAAAPKPKSGAKTAPELSTTDEILTFIDTYRTKPEPDRLGRAVKAMSRLGVFKDVDTAGVYIGFMGGVLGANPKRAEALVAAMFPMPPEDQVAIVRAIAYSGLDDWKGLLVKFVERMPARKVLIDRYLQDKLPPLKKLGLESGPSVLDANWGAYLASGEEAPVYRIVDALAWARDGDNIDKLTVAGMAKWTLAKNAQRDHELLGILKRRAAIEKGDIGRELREVIEAVETYEIGKMRKEAIARIEEIKQKGGASKRNVSWWAQAGSTALALGCVTAAALGQVQVGIPCVIGGSLSSAATKLLLPQ